MTPTTTAIRSSETAGLGTHRTTPPVWAIGLIGLQAILGSVDFELLGMTPAPWVIATCMMPLVFLVVRSHRLVETLWTPPLRASTIWLFWSSLSVVWSITRVTTAGAVLATLGLWTTAVWFTSEFGFARFSRAYTGAMAVFLTAGFIRDITILFDAGTVHRFAGYSLHPNNLSQIALITVLLSTIQLVERLHRSFLTWWSLVIGLLALVATGTRSALLALVVCLFVIALRSLGLTRTILIGLALAASAMVAISMIPDPGDFVTRDENAQDLSSINGRKTIWSVALRATVDAPVLGNGVSSGQFVFPQARRMGELPFPRIEHAHNMMLELSMSTGLVGVALFLIALASYLASGRPPGGRLTGVVMLAVMLIGTTEPVLSWRTSMYLVVAALFTERATAYSSVGNGTDLSVSDDDPAPVPRVVRSARDIPGLSSVETNVSDHQDDGG